MKNTILTILILTCFLYSCASDSSKEELLPDLVRAEALMYSYPDSALTILETMPVPVPSNRLQNATWSLLLVQARDKNYVKHTSDSTINVAYDYFMKQDDPGRKALVLNYEGRVNQDLGEVEKATRLYLKAKDAAGQTDDYKLRFLIESNLGTIYLYRSLYEQALDAFTEAHSLAQKINEPGYLSSVYSYLGRVYSVTKRFEEAISVYKRAIDEAEKSNDMYDLSCALGELAAVYQTVGNCDSAFFYLKQDEKITITKGLKSIAQTYLGIGSLYSQQGKYDSAQVYLNKSLSLVKNPYTKRAIYEELSRIEEKKQNYKDAYVYSKLYINIQDTLQQQSKRKEIATIQAQYNHEKLKNENALLRSEKDQAMKMALCILLFVVATACYIFSVYQRKLLQKERVLQQKKKQLEDNVVELYQNEQEIRKNQSRIQYLADSLATSTAKDEEQKLEIKQLYDQNEYLEKSNKGLQKSMDELKVFGDQNELIQTYETLKVENKELSDRVLYLYDKLTGLLLLERFKNITTEEQWLDVEKATDLLHHNFIGRLKNSIPDISQNDLRFCCMLKLGFTNSKIAALTMVEPAAITKHKQRLKKSLPNELKERFTQRNSFEEWLQEL